MVCSRFSHKGEREKDIHGNKNWVFKIMVVWRTSWSFAISTEQCHSRICIKSVEVLWYLPPIARFMGPTWGPSGADRSQVGPILAPWTMLSGYYHIWLLTFVKSIRPIRTILYIPSHCTTSLTKKLTHIIERMLYPRFLHTVKSCYNAV